VELDSGLASQVRSSLANALLENASTESKAKESPSGAMNLLGPSAP
jgi:hypothetical protein